MKPIHLSCFGKLFSSALAFAMIVSTSFTSPTYQVLAQSNNSSGESGVNTKDKSLLTEMSAKSSSQNAVAPDLCPYASQQPNIPYLFSDDMESGSAKWIFGSTPGYTTDWFIDTVDVSSPTHALRGPAENFANDAYAATSADISLPSGISSYLYFNHAFNFESSYSFGGYDGGVLEYSVDQGATWKDDADLFFSAGQDYNFKLLANYLNPLENRLAFSGISDGVVSSRYDLSNLAGKNVRFRWRTGSDYYNISGTQMPGWYVDDVTIYTCPNVADPAAPIVNTFAAATPSNALQIPITDFSASDNIGVTGYMITTSPVTPVYGDVGWTDSVPTSFTVTANGTYTLYPWARDIDRHVSYPFASPFTVIVASPPTVSSINLTNPSPTNLATVNFTVTFSESVTGVDIAGPTFDDFSLITSGVTGASINSVSGSGATYTVSVNTGSGNGIIQLTVNTGGHIINSMNVLFASNYIAGPAYSVIKGPIFADVPTSYWAYSYVNRLYLSSITSGCASSPQKLYCPDALVTRAEMSIFLLRSKHMDIPNYNPPAATGTVFNDVPLSNWAAPWIEQFSAEGITGGCGVKLYCPNASVTRAEMAIFLLRGKHGSSYVPPAAKGIFTDVPLNYWAVKWIEQLAAEGITSGCGTNKYCPNATVSRAEMAVFLVRAFNLP